MLIYIITMLLGCCAMCQKTLMILTYTNAKAAATIYLLTYLVQLWIEILPYYFSILLDF